MNEPFKPAGHPLLDAGRFDAVAENSWTLPSSWYFEPEIFRLEHEAIFHRTWWYHCHVGDVANPGDYHVGEFAGQSVVVLRGGDGVVRAFHNVCSHRAHPLLAGAGNTRLIVCPYHQWCYQTDGRFRSARGRDSLKDWIPENADLKPVRVEVFGGLLFVNLDPHATPLAEQAGALLADMRRTCPGIEHFHRAERFERDVAANWKTVIDNNHECYHCAVNHPSLMELVDYDTKAVWSADGITFSHAVEKKRLDNAAYALAPGDIAQESLFGYIWPCTIPLMFPGSQSLAVFQVLPTGPETARERWDFYFSQAEPTDQERRFVAYVKETLIPEDVGLCESVQKGLHSLGYRQGRFVVDRAHSEFSEHHVHFFQKFVHEALTGTLAR